VRVTLPDTFFLEPSLVLSFTNLRGTCLPEITIRKTFDTGSNCTRPSRKPTVLIPLVERIRMGKPREISQEWKQEPTYKGMTPPSIQNLKALGLRILFLICCSTFSFLPSMKLRLTLVPNNKWAFLFYFLWENIYLIFVFIFC